MDFSFFLSKAYIKVVPAYIEPLHMTFLEVVDDEVNEPAPPSSLGSPENVNQRNDQGIELPRMNRRYPQ